MGDRLAHRSQPFKLATFNVNSVRKRLPHVLTWVKQHRPDVLCLQETKVEDHAFPTQPLMAAGYHVVMSGTKGYNGVAVLGRHPITVVRTGFEDGEDPDEPSRLIHVLIDDLPVINVYAPQGFSIDSPKYAYKLHWFRRLRRYFARHLSADQPALLCGDLNVAPAPIDVHHPERHLKHVCFHEEVRQAYHTTMAWGFVDVYRLQHPRRQQFTFWDYRQPYAVQANRGWRFDHILATPSLANRCRRAEVDLEPRLAPSPSDHTIVWAEFHL
ncbi:MAG: exodeoxyribonuclease III [Nitrospirae bacterium]|nr:MAG: exodeoxyribonuclease III [Nitrospirota bacterium]